MAQTYTIVHNGIEKDFDHSNPKIDLKKGVNFLKVKTDKSCQDHIHRKYL